MPKDTVIRMCRSFTVFTINLTVPIAYKEKATEWEKIYATDSHKQNKESVLERLKNPPKRTANFQQQKAAKSKDRGAR